MCKRFLLVDGFPLDEGLRCISSSDSPKDRDRAVRYFPNPAILADE